MWDSHAISTYLISKYGKEDDPLYPKDLYTRARIDQRLQFDNSQIFKCLVEIFLPFYMGIAYDITEASIANANNAFAFLEAFLETDTYLVGDQLTVADLCTITTVLQLNAVVPFDTQKYSKLNAWVKRLQALPYFYEVNTKHMDEFIAEIVVLRAMNKEAAEKKM